MVINKKEISTKNTTILYNSSYNYNVDAVEFINQGCEIIDRTRPVDLKVDSALLEEFNCLYLKEKEVLTIQDEIKVNLLNSLVCSSNIVVFLNVLTYVDYNFKQKLITKLKENKKQIINYTCDIEETLLLDYVIVLNDNNVIMEGSTKAVLKEEKILKKLGYNLPFIVELSTGLKYYNLISKIYYDNKSLVNDLWK